MIAKAPDTLSMAMDTLYLSSMDQNIVRVYTQTLLIFPFPDGTQAEGAIRVLREGLCITLLKFPFLTGTLSLTNPKSGKLSLTFPSDLSAEQMARIFTSKYIPYDEKSFPHSYEQLRREGMPPSVFKGEMFCPDGLKNYAGVPSNGEGIVNFELSDAPAMRVQACFIPGGLVVSTYVHHSVMDCSGINHFWKYFAKNVSKSTQISKRTRPADPAPEIIPDQSTLRFELDTRIPKLTSGQRPTAESYIDGTYNYRKTLHEGTECSQKYFVISAAHIRRFRDHIRSYFPTGSPPTICNVLAALTWIHVTRARAARLLAQGYKESHIGIAVDLRKRMTPPLGEAYMGNMALFAKGTLPIEKLIEDERVTTETIIDTIKVIKKTIDKVQHDWIMNHLNFFKSIEQIKDTECALGFRFGADIYITSWMNFGADYQWNIPGTDMANGSLEGRPEFIRRSYNPSDGGMMIMPRRRHLVNGKEAPYEVMVRLAKEDLTRLENEEGGLKKKWAERVLN